MEQPEPGGNDELIVEMTAEVVAAYVSNNVVPVSDLPSLITDVFKALGHASQRQEPIIAEQQKPAVPVKKSVQNDQITCLECGLKLKSLKRHLATSHNMTPAEYREKWELRSEYPMVAPDYAEARSRLAKEAGLGQKGKIRKRPRR